MKILRAWQDRQPSGKTIFPCNRYLHMEYAFNNVPVEIAGEAHAFNYRYTEAGRYRQASHLTSEGKELIIDRHLKSRRAPCLKTGSNRHRLAG